MLSPKASPNLVSNVTNVDQKVVGEESRRSRHDHDEESSADAPPYCKTLHLLGMGGVVVVGFVGVHTSTARASF